MSERRAETACRLDDIVELAKSLRDVLESCPVGIRRRMADRLLELAARVRDNIHAQDDA